MGKLSKLQNKSNSDGDNSVKKRKKPVEAKGGQAGSEKSLTPLSEVVSGCRELWFRETLEEANAGDISNQLLVSQMYNNGYGVAKDEDKARFWISRAFGPTASGCKLSYKRPGYRESDSDTDELANTS